MIFLNFKNIIILANKILLEILEEEVVGVQIGVLYAVESR